MRDHRVRRSLRLGSYDDPGGVDRIGQRAGDEDIALIGLRPEEREVIGAVWIATSLHFRDISVADGIRLIGHGYQNLA